MNLSPDPAELLARARADIRMGLPVVLQGEHPIAFAAAETLDEDRARELVAVSDQAVLVMSARRATTLKAHAYDGDIARLVLPKDADLSWLRGVADPANDLRTPMKGPLVSTREGDASPYRFALKLAKSARLLPAVLCIPLSDGSRFAQDHDLVSLDLETVQKEMDERSPLHQVVTARLPLEVSEAGRLHIFRPEDGSDEHYAIEIGKPDRARPVLTRLHSACFTGDLMGSLKCDCGPQLRAALAHMGREGHGVLLYMNQEGRGIGLANKMRAYSLQDQGFDTVEANHRLGFEDDERDFRLGSDILRNMGFTQARLITNNPRKVEMMTASGIEVIERVPLHVGENRHNKDYLATKRTKSGHLK